MVLLVQAHARKGGIAGDTETVAASPSEPGYKSMCVWNNTGVNPRMLRALARAFSHTLRVRAYVIV